MLDDVFHQYKAESSNWMKRGRSSLLRALLDEAVGGRQGVELLEIGAGVGQNVPTLAQFGRVDVAEISPVGLEVLRTRPGIETIYEDPIPFALNKPYDVICALDVIEHLEDDRAATEWIARGLKPGGYFIASVPAYPWLFSDHDVALGHYRRYTKSSFNRLLPSGLQLVKSGYFNSTLFPLPAAKRLGERLVKRLGKGRPSVSPGGPKESSDVPAWLDPIFGAILSAEVTLFRQRPVMPFGLSVFTLARKVD